MKDLAGLIRGTVSQLVAAVQLPPRPKSDPVFGACKQQNMLMQTTGVGFGYCSTAKFLSNSCVIAGDEVHLNTFGMVKLGMAIKQIFIKK